MCVMFVCVFFFVRFWGYFRCMCFFLEWGEGFSVVWFKDGRERRVNFAGCDTLMNWLELKWHVQDATAELPVK